MSLLWCLEGMEVRKNSLLKSNINGKFLNSVSGMIGYNVIFCRELSPGMDCHNLLIKLTFA